MARMGWAMVVGGVLCPVPQKPEAVGRKDMAAKELREAVGEDW